MDNGPVTQYVSTDGAVYGFGHHLIGCPTYSLSVRIEGVDERLKELPLEKVDDHGGGIRALEVVPDHVHGFVFRLPKHSRSDIANQFKGCTSRALRQEFPWLRSHLHALGSLSYLAATVGNVSEATVQRYIGEQTTR